MNLIEYVKEKESVLLSTAEVRAQLNKKEMFIDEIQSAFKFKNLIRNVHFYPLFLIIQYA